MELISLNKNSLNTEFNLLSEPKQANLSRVFLRDVIEECSSNQENPSSPSFFKAIFLTIKNSSICLFFSIAKLFRNIFCCCYSKQITSEEILKKLNDMQLIAGVEQDKLDALSHFRDIYSSLPKEIRKGVKEAAFEVYLKDPDNHFPKTFALLDDSWKKSNADFYNLIALTYTLNIYSENCKKTLENYLEYFNKIEKSNYKLTCKKSSCLSIILIPFKAIFFFFQKILCCCCKRADESVDAQKVKEMITISNRDFEDRDFISSFAKIYETLSEDSKEKLKELALENYKIPIETDEQWKKINDRFLNLIAKSYILNVFGPFSKEILDKYLKNKK